MITNGTVLVVVLRSKGYGRKAGIIADKFRVLLHSLRQCNGCFKYPRSPKLNALNADKRNVSAQLGSFLLQSRSAQAAWE